MSVFGWKNAGKGRKAAGEKDGKAAEKAVRIFCSDH